MNLVLIGSLVAARRMDSRATASVTPSTSNNTFAGRMTATQDSSGPLPLPIRVSSGFLVKDLCGKMRIHILPRRFMLRVTATRAASICLVSSQQRSSAMQSVFAKRHGAAARGHPGAAAAVHLAILNSCGLQWHNQNSLNR